MTNPHTSTIMILAAEHPVLVSGVVYGLVVLIGLIGSAVFSGIETAVYQMSRLRLLVREREGDPQAIRLHHETSQPQRLLSTLLIGNNAVNFLTSFGVTAILTRLLGLGDWASIGVQAVVLTPLLLVAGETLPKEMARAHADTVVYSATSLLQWTRRVLTVTGILPLVEWLGDLVARLLGEAEGVNRPSARARVAALMSEGVGHGVLTENQTDLANRALLMRDTSVRRLMVPWSQVVTLPASMTVAEFRGRLETLEHSQYPVVNSRGEVVGVVSILKLLLVRPRDRGQVRIRDFMDVPVNLEPRMNARGAVMRLRRANATLAIVGAKREPDGILTLTDIVQPLVSSTAAVRLM